ncbi:hypothetical protein Tdes44962_MAKER10131 [Teratosphaeria destructans]|uniref:Uncharacterized protein n=1 Tax=Teratosphaeria destructans TaxID=418781 RepID=A0A9W7W142_9PEZI|nr:hypothetical protein Tdes44962_MAKER10131 [Teratosphaeria destructans]
MAPATPAVQHITDTDQNTTPIHPSPQPRRRTKAVHFRDRVDMQIYFVSLPDSLDLFGLHNTSARLHPSACLLRHQATAFSFRLLAPPDHSTPVRKGYSDARARVISAQRQYSLAAPGLRPGYVAVVVAGMVGWWALSVWLLCRIAYDVGKWGEGMW